MKTITVEINNDGEVTIATSGFKGEACQRATAEMEKALGITAHRMKTAEAYQSEVKAGQYVGNGGTANAYPKGRWP